MWQKCKQSSHRQREHLICNSRLQWKIVLAFVSCTFPVSCTQGSFFSKVDNVSGSSHGNLWSDPKYSAVRPIAGSVKGDGPSPWSNGTVHQAAHIIDSKEKQLNKIWNKNIKMFLVFRYTKVHGCDSYHKLYTCNSFLTTRLSFK